MANRRPQGGRPALPDLREALKLIDAHLAEANVEEVPAGFLSAAEYGKEWRLSNTQTHVKLNRAVEMGLAERIRLKRGKAWVHYFKITLSNS